MTTYKVTIRIASKKATKEQKLLIMKTPVKSHLA